MSGLESIRGSVLWYLLCFAAIALVLGQLGLLMQSAQNKRTRLLAALNLLLDFALLAVVMDCAYAGIASAADRALLFRPLQWALFALPWGLYALCEALCAVLLLLSVRSLRRYRLSHLTPESIRRAVDLLPVGLCVSAPDGTVLLSNLKMNALCRTLCGGGLSDAGSFLRQLRERGEEQNGSLLVRTQDGEMWLFTEKRLTAEGQDFDQLTAADVTERYRIIEELREKNDRLLDIQQRMRAVSKQSADMFVAQEEAAARAALHNQLGQVLLMGRHYLRHPDSTDAKVMAVTTRQMNAFLLGEAEEPGWEHEDGLSSALLMAGSIGVTVTLSGPEPQDVARRELLALAIREGAANAIKHAEASALSVLLTERDGTTVAALSNNGRAPISPVVESGGLLALRRRVEAFGGRMEIQSVPRFLLTLELPKKAKEQHSPSAPRCEQLEYVCG